MNVPDPAAGQPADAELGAPTGAEPGVGEPVRSRTQRLRDGAGRVDHARVAVTGKAVPVLQRAVKLTRFPTFLVMAAPIASAIALVIVSFFADGSIRWVLLGVAVLILLIGIAFGRRRGALMDAVADRDQLTHEFVQAFSAGNAWSRIQPQLTSMASDVSSPRQGFAMIRNWRGLLSVAIEATSGLDDYPRVTPFTPGSLRTTWLLGVLSVIAGFIGAALTVLVLILLALGLA